MTNLVPSKGHAHAALMLQYAQDAATCTEPYTLWELKSSRDGREWEPCYEHPAWHVNMQYRRKPRTIRIGAVDVPEPLRLAPAAGVMVWCARVLNTDYCESWLYCDTDGQRRALARGLLHTDREAAMAHGEALVALSKGE